MIVRHGSRYRGAVPDHGRVPAFGWFLVPTVDDPLLATAQEADRRGLDYLGIQDHPYQRRYVDTWVLMSMIAATTSRIRIFPDVTSLPLRPPAVLAKAAASLDVLSGGRFELGLGAGAFWAAIEGYGGPRRSPGEALAALADAVEVIRLVWSGQRNLRYEGRHYRLAGAHSGPVPAHDIGIWLGVHGPRAIELAGRVADGWIPSLQSDPAPLLDMAARLDEAAGLAGRDPGDIRRILNVHGDLTDRGRWVDELTDLAVGPGFDTFVFWSDVPDQLAVYAEEVVPAVRAAVAAERA